MTQFWIMETWCKWYFSLPVNLFNVCTKSSDCGDYGFTFEGNPSLLWIVTDSDSTETSWPLPQFRKLSGFYIVDNTIAVRMNELISVPTIQGFKLSFASSSYYLKEIYDDMYFIF